MSLYPYLRRASAPLIFLTGLCACANPDYQDRTYESDADSSTADPGKFIPQRSKLRCTDPRASEQVPARGVTMTRAATDATASMSVDDLYGQFTSHCGGCHVDQALGEFQVNRRTFAERVDRDVLARIRSNDPKIVMPPPPSGKPFDERPAGDALVDFTRLLGSWIDADRPEDVFRPPAGGLAAHSAYFLSEEVGMKLTNLGSCVPSKEGFGEAKDRAEALDEKFAAMTELPIRLEDTDLFTLDGRVLASHGVVAFVPGYPLWSDGSQKMRFIRVPQGKSVVFDKETQTFSIPDNTRFYKTFFKRVKDKDGSERYRKMETRLIVARADDDTNTGLDRVRALFGTYIWNEQETEAVLLRDPLRNGKPFRDRLITYYLDEQRAEELIRAGEPDVEKTLRDENLLRHHAVPGRERCIHCHVGSPTKDFVLGFLPLQIHRRPEGEGGVIEPVGDDELNQLERLIDYGVVTGLASPDDVRRLEESQGSRTPRNAYELDAQGYMLGNCAHCHNPRGFPSLVASELRDVLDFMPSETGGIFRFPLDRFSPRVTRGVDQDIRMPYITPSLYDLPTSYEDLEGKIRICGGVSIGPQLAPWRSLIYRNVSTPFSYDDDFAIFPHMPRDTAGFDCRARQILGLWMVGIPARWKGQDLPEAPPDITVLNEYEFREAGYTPDDPDDFSQPYEEITEDHPKFRHYSLARDLRVAKFREGERYKICPDPERDIVDPNVTSGDLEVPLKETAQELPDEQCISGGGVLPERPHWFLEDLTEPDVAWGPRRVDWEGRIVLGHIPEQSSTTIEEERNKNDRQTMYIMTGADPWKRLPPRPSVGLTKALKDFALGEFPLGLWQDRPGCDFSSVKRASDADFQGAKRPHWFDSAGPDFTPITADAPIYTIPPGAQVFNSICSNCHGPEADSRGRMAGLVSDLTGGNTRVANLRDGFFGPASDPASARAGVFGDAVSGAGGVSVEDWAVRYLLWMGLGGTQRTIPSAVLNVVANTQVLGVRREGLYGLGNVGANMLAVAEFLCAKVMPFSSGVVIPSLRFDVGRGDVDDLERYPDRGRTELPKDPPLPLISTNGDAELWRWLCTLDNPAPVRVLRFDEGKFRLAQKEQTRRDDDGNVLMETGADGSPRPSRLLYPELVRRESYPVDARVGDPQGTVQPSLQASNGSPWCVVPPAASDYDAMLRAYRSARPWDGATAAPPFCPDEIVDNEDVLFDDASARTWMRRGAMNAGMSVFVYLDALAKGDVRRPVEYNRCDELP